MIQLTNNHWAVEVPDDASHIKIHDSYQCSKIVFSSDIQDPLKCGGDMIRIPPGSWQYLFTTKGCTEEDARKVVRKEAGGFVDYEKDNFHNDIPYTYASQSLYALLASKSLDPDKNYAILLKQTNNEK